jgi:hypothetical protein
MRVHFPENTTDSANKTMREAVSQAHVHNRAAECGA